MELKHYPLLGQTQVEFPGSDHRNCGTDAGLMLRRAITERATSWDGKRPRLLIRPFAAQPFQRAAPFRKRCCHKLGTSTSVPLRILSNL